MPADDLQVAARGAIESATEEYDAFISHAWEDKAAFVRPLAERLRQRGLKVWYDEFEIAIGDGLRKSIDRGLTTSRFGIVVLSPAFFAKHWPQEELEGLAAREASGKKVILPVWYNIGREELLVHSPMLAGRYAAQSKDGLEKVVEDILRAIRPGEATAEPAPGAAVTPQLIAFGPDIVTTGTVIGVEPRLWTARVDEFVEGDFNRLIKLSEGFQSLPPEQRYVLVGALGDGRQLMGPVSITSEGRGYLVRCPIEPSFTRITAQRLPSSMASSPETFDLYLKNGNIARTSGVESFPQRLREALSMLRGESPMHLNYGSRLQEYYWRFKDSGLLNAMLALDVIRMSSVPYDASTPVHTPLMCVERVWGVTPLQGEPTNGRLPMQLDMDVMGLGRVQYVVPVAMPDAEKTQELG